MPILRNSYMYVPFCPILKHAVIIILQKWHCLQRTYLHLTLTLTTKLGGVPFHETILIIIKINKNTQSLTCRCRTRFLTLSLYFLQLITNDTIMPFRFKNRNVATNKIFLDKIWGCIQGDFSIYLLRFLQAASPILL